jgi:hypothetical protein
VTCPTWGSSTKSHNAVIEEALLELGWQDPAQVEEVCRYSTATDLVKLPGWTLGMVECLFPNAGKRIPLVREMAETAPFSPKTSSGFHFNDLYSFSAIETRWKQLEAWVDRMSREMARDSGSDRHREGYLCLLGMVAHAVQDFYAHSNWVGILNKFTEHDFEPDEFPLWEELVEEYGDWRSRHPDFPRCAALNRLWVSNASVSDKETLGGLQTGRTFAAKPVDSKPWRHRHKRGQERVVVHTLSKRALRLWIGRINAHVNTHGMPVSFVSSL